jgi:Ca2+-binding EF-hand superfamily protein
LFRKELALQNVEEKVKQRQEHLAKVLASDFPEGEALKDFCTQLKAKNLSPEAFFRVCDSGYKRRISKEAFSKGLEKFKIKLSKTQEKRLLILFDEHMTGNITLEEFQNALEAFELNVEDHFLTSNPKKAHRPFSIQALDSYFEILNSRKLTATEMFTTAAGEDGKLDLNEFRDFLMQLRPEFTIKELQQIKNFYDVNRDGIISHDEFISADTRAKNSVKKRTQQE